MSVGLNQLDQVGYTKLEGLLNPKKLEEHAKAKDHLAAMFANKSFRPQSIDQALTMDNKTEIVVTRTIEEEGNVDREINLDASFFKGQLDPCNEENGKALGNLKMLTKKNKNHVASSVSEGLSFALYNLNQGCTNY